MRLANIRSLSLAAIAAVTLSLSLAARANDYTDIWWAPCTQGASCDPTAHESGWGVNFVQNEDIVFATFYIYDVNKQPIWYSAAMTSTGSGTYVGPFYQTSGSFFGNAWNPAEHPAATLVGSSTFTPSSATTGTLSYTVTTGPNTGTATKQIVRFAFKSILLGGNYSGVLSSTTTQCKDSSQNGTMISDIDPQVTQLTDGTLQIIVAFYGSAPGSSCTLTGIAVQEGQLYRVPVASYTCTYNNINTTATLYEIKATALGNRRTLVCRQRRRMPAGRELLRASALKAQALTRPRCRTHSNRHTAAAAAALSDSIPPGIGIVTRCVACATSAGASPAPSLPIATATRPASRAE